CQATAGALVSRAGWSRATSFIVAGVSRRSSMPCARGIPPSIASSLLFTRGSMLGWSGQPRSRFWRTSRVWLNAGSSVATVPPTSTAPFLRCSCFAFAARVTGIGRRRHTAIEHRPKLREERADSAGILAQIVLAVPRGRPHVDLGRLRVAHHADHDIVQETHDEGAVHGLDVARLLEAPTRRRFRDD